MSNRHVAYDVTKKKKRKKKPKKKILQAFRQVKAGDKILLINHWYKKTKVKKGSKGIVKYVDSHLSVLVEWDCGEKFWLLPKLDKFIIT
tara:strand:+ start:2363 stop:2629 length:267 start_codon:yes stop_codon:yes gene_type:complete